MNALKRMSQQQELFSSSSSPKQASMPVSASERVNGAQAPQQAPQRIPRWLVRAELSLRVLLRVYIGLAIVYAPWSGHVLTYLPWSRILWDHNPIFVQFPTLGMYAANGAVRGIVSGLGLLNLWAAFSDALHHRG
jgi:hypothetical protein